MVGVAVAAVLVVGHEDLRPHLAEDLDQEQRRLVEVGLPERVRPVVGGQPHHPGVAVAARPAEEAVVADAERLHRGGQLVDPVPAELVLLVGGEVRELGDEHLALLAQGAGDQGDLGALGGVARHRRAVADRLVVGVGVHEQQPPVGVEGAHDRLGLRLRLLQDRLGLLQHRVLDRGRRPPGGGGLVRGRSVRGRRHESGPYPLRGTG